MPNVDPTPVAVDENDPEVRRLFHEWDLEVVRDLLPDGLPQERSSPYDIVRDLLPGVHDEPLVGLSPYVVVADDSLDVEGVSPQFAELLGYEPEDLYGVQREQLAANPTTPAALERAFSENGCHRGVVQALHADGHTIPYRFMMRPVGRMIVAVGKPVTRPRLIDVSLTEWPDEECEWLTKEQAARRASLSVRTVERAMATGELPYSGGGPHKLAVRIRAVDLDEWAAHRR